MPKSFLIKKKKPESELKTASAESQLSTPGRLLSVNLLTRGMSQFYFRLQAISTLVSL